MIDRALRKLFNAEAPPPMIWEPQIHGRLYPDRPYFFTRVRQGMAKLPNSLQIAFKEKGSRVIVARRSTAMFDNAPSLQKELKKDNFSNFEKNLLRAFTHLFAGWYDGMAISQDRIAVMPQATLLGTIYGQLNSLTKLSSVQQTTLHEIGHIFDGILYEADKNNSPYYKPSPFEGLRSNTENFKEALEEDKENIKFWHLLVLMFRTNMAHLGIYSDRNRAEFFAELFRENINGGGPLSKHFPKAARYVQREIKDIADESLEKYPGCLQRTYPKMEVATT